MSENLIRTWIVNNKNMPIGDLIKNLDFDSYGYRKYGETVFAMKQGPWNVPLADLSEKLHDGTRKGYEDTKEFAEYLGERIVLCLKYFKGKTNKEIEQEICNRIKDKEN